jgi:hypothetical protein
LRNKWRPRLSQRQIRIIHDFDNPYLSGRYALRRGLALILFAASKKLRLLRPLAKRVYRECYDYCLTLAKIDRLLGVQSHFGIKDEVAREFPELVSELQALGFQVHRHYHVSRENVGWDPSLDIDQRSWFFDQEYARNKMIPDSLDWAVFHADYPFLIDSYIDFLSKAPRTNTAK